MFDILNNRSWLWFALKHIWNIIEEIAFEKIKKVQLLKTISSIMLHICFWASHTPSQPGTIHFLIGALFSGCIGETWKYVFHFSIMEEYIPYFLFNIFSMQRRKNTVFKRLTCVEIVNTRSTFQWHSPFSPDNNKLNYQIG